MYDEMVQHGTYLRRYHPELVKVIIRCYNKGTKDNHCRLNLDDQQEQQLKSVQQYHGLEQWVSYPLHTNQDQEVEDIDIDKSSLICCRGLEYMVTRKFKRESKCSVRSILQLYTT